MKGNLVLNEKLVESFLNEDKHSYKIPKNWIWVHLGKICDVNMGQSPKGEYTTDEPNNVPLVGGPADMGDLYPNSHRYTVKPTKLSEKGELIVSVRATLGKTNFADRRYCLGRGVAGIRSKIIDVRLLKYFFDVIKPYLYSVSTGTTFQQVSKKDIEGISIPLPPQNEQIRIVDKIEQLLSKIDEAKRLIEEAKETFELRRAAVLDKAFRGELTRNWRESSITTITPIEETLQIINLEKNKLKNKVSKLNETHECPFNVPDSWEWVRLDEICLSLKNGLYKAANYYSDSGTPCLRMYNIDDNKLNLKDMHYMILTNEEIKEYGLEYGDILVNRVNSRELVGKCAAVPKNFPTTVFESKNIRIRLHSQISAEYISAFMNSKYVKKWILDTCKQTVGMATINQEFLKGVLIPLPPVEEQKQIIKYLNSILLAEEKIKTTLTLFDKLNVLKQSILSKAFRGELGTNDPTEESAIELLKEVLQEQVK